jgi:hypothetical protein
MTYLQPPQISGDAKLVLVSVNRGSKPEVGQMSLLLLLRSLLGTFVLGAGARPG